MRIYFIAFVGGIILSLLSCRSTPDNASIEVFETFSEIETMIEKDNDKLWVVNFWATSCPPCLKEMPHFNLLQKQYPEANILLVSLDRAKELDSRVYPFVQKHNIVPEVVVLEDQDYSSWTDKIDPSWYGALPATLIKKKNQRKFRFGAYSTFQELEDDIKQVIAQ